MTDLNENAPFDEVTEVSNTDTQEHSDIETVSESDAEIDAINEALAEAEDLENNTHDSEKDALSDSENDDISENNTHEVSEDNETGTVAENETVELSGNPEQLEEPSEPEPQPNPWDDAPKDVYFYDKTYEDGHLGSFTESPEMAYKFGWDIENNYILIADTEKSDVNGWTYPTELCPHKSPEDISKEKARERIAELKKFLSATDYKAIKYAEGALTADEYEPDRQARADARAEINRLEASL